jgi:hypothetical protein
MRRSLRIFVGVVAAAITAAALAAAASAANIQGDYQFQGNNASTGGTYGPLVDLVGSGNPANAFTSATVDGVSRTVLGFPKGNGLSAPVPPIDVPYDQYTIVMLLRFDGTSSSWRRLIEFRGGTSDNGLYFTPGNVLTFWPSLGTGTTTVAIGSWNQVVLTRDSAGTVTGYVNGNQEFSFSDSTNQGVMIDPSDPIHFFQDNTSGGTTGEDDAGAVARIRLYDDALSATEVAALDRLPSAVGPASIKVTVKPAPPATAPTADPMASAPIQQGQQFVVTATALDLNGVKMKTYSGPATWSDSAGALSGSPSPFVNGVSSTTTQINVPLKDDTITVSSNGTHGTSKSFDVFGPIASMTVSGVPGRATAGTPFTVKATAYDSVGNKLTTYNDCAATWSDTTGTLAPAAPSCFANGVSQTSATVSTTTPADVITITSNGVNGQSRTFQVR